MSRTGGYNYMYPPPMTVHRPNGLPAPNNILPIQMANNQPQTPGGLAMSWTGGSNYVFAAPVAAPQPSGHTANNNAVQYHTNTFHHQGVSASSSARSHGSTSGAAMPMNQRGKEGANVASSSSPLNPPRNEHLRLDIRDIIHADDDPRSPLPQGTIDNSGSESTAGDRGSWQTVVLCVTEEPQEQTPNTPEQPQSAPGSPEFCPPSPGPFPQPLEERRQSPVRLPRIPELGPESLGTLPWSPASNPPSPDIVHQLGTNNPFNTGNSFNLLTEGFPEGKEPTALTPSGYR
jgi:hypothetical protein